MYIWAWLVLITGSARALDPSCAAILSLNQLAASRSRMSPDINELLRRFRDARVAIAEDDKPREFSLAADPTTDRLPIVSRPRGDEGYFHVMIRAEAKGPSGVLNYELDQSFSLLNRFEGDRLVTELEVSVGDFHVLDPLSLYVALAVTPFASRVRMVQNVSRPEVVAHFIRRMSKTADPLAALAPYQAPLALIMNLEGFPLVRAASSYEPYRIDAGRFNPSSVKRAEAVRFEYRYDVLDRARLN